MTLGVKWEMKFPTISDSGIPGERHVRCHHNRDRSPNRAWPVAGWHANSAITLPAQEKEAANKHIPLFISPKKLPTGNYCQAFSIWKILTHLPEDIEDWVLTDGNPIISLPRRWVWICTKHNWTGRNFLWAEGLGQATFELRSHS